MAHQQQLSTSPDSSRSLLAIVMAVTPLYYLSLQARSRLGLSLDNLHLGLIQVLLLLILGRLSSWFGERTRRSTSTTSTKVNPHLAQKVDSASTGISATPSQAVSGEQSGVQGNGPTISKRRQNRASTKRLKSHSLFTPSVCDSIVGKFLSATEPDYLALLPEGADQGGSSDRTPLSAWTVLHTTDSLSVLQHPESKKMLYAIQASFPGVPLRNLFEVLTDIKQRPKWDGMAQGSDELERFEIGTKDGREIKGALVWLAMKGVALIKAKDMILVSLAGRLPPSADKKVADALQEQQNAAMSTADKSDAGTRAEAGDAGDDTAEKPEKKQEGADSAPVPTNNDKLRIYCATTSFEHPDHPPRSGFNRMPLGIAGFLIEDDGQGGSKITQITDLSGLGSWVPSAVLRTVTQTMLPKSLTKLGKAAAEFDLASSSKYPLDGTDWMPPVLGAQAPESSIMTTANGAGTADELDEDEEGDGVSSSSASSSMTLVSSDEEAGVGKSTSSVSPSSSRDLHALVAQLRSLTSRLTALERGQVVSGSGSSSSKTWYSSLLGGSGSGTQQGLMTRSSSSATAALSNLLVTAAGGAAGAAVVLGVLKAWERRRR